MWEIFNLMCKLLKMQLCGNTLTALFPLEAQPWGRVTDTEEAKCLSSLCLRSPVVKHRKPIWRACIFPSKKKNNNTARLWGQARATSCISKRHEKCILSGCNPDLTCVLLPWKGEDTDGSQHSHIQWICLCINSASRSCPCTAAKEPAPQWSCSPVQLMSWHNRISASWGFSVCKLVSAANRHKLNRFSFLPQDNFFSANTQSYSNHINALSIWKQISPQDLAIF